MRRKKTDYYAFERARARGFSAVLHLFYLLLIIFGLPSFLMPSPPQEPFAISVEILPVTGVTNVKPSEKKAPAESKQQEKQKEEKPSPPAKPKEEVTPPEPIAPAKAKEAKQKPKEDKKPEPKKEKKPSDDMFKSLLNEMKNKSNKDKKDDTKKTDDKSVTQAPSATSNKFNPAMLMTMSEMDVIMSQIAKCWSIPAGAKDAENLVPVLMAEYNNDGSLLNVTVADQVKSRYNSDSFFRTAVDAAIRAVKQCTPLKSLPPEKYNTWRSLELHFDPKAMLN